MKKENVKVVIKNKSHSRMSLSGIFNACCNKIRGKTLLNEYVEDPRLQASGMTALFNNGLTPRGFTLIELLVVVLIIGILAAVALPQYQKAVEKTRAAVALTVLNTLQKAVDVYALEHGFSDDDILTTFLGESSLRDDNVNVELDIDLFSPQNCNLDADSHGFCYSKDFIYYAYCNGSWCHLLAARGTNEAWIDNDMMPNGNYLTGKYVLHYHRDRQGKWSKSCRGNCPKNLI